MQSLTSLLNTLYTSDHWPVIAFVLRILLFIVLLWGGWLLWRTPTGKPTKQTALPWNFRLFMIAMTTAFVLLLAHQAVWQLAGQHKPEFVAFMQLHDRRAFNPAHRIQRGRILDRKGIVLAESKAHRKGFTRVYPIGPAAAHVVGYTDPLFGSFGMEKAGNATLMGATFTSLEEWKSLGRGLFDPDRTIVGRDLQLTLDARLQQKAYHLLGSFKGAVIIMDAREGDLLTLASRPSFDPGKIDRSLFSGQRGDSVLLNRATHGLYPPGSTFKVITAALALKEGFSGTIHCPADGWTTSPANPKIRDYGFYAAQKKGEAWSGYGDLDLGTALAKSSNIFFARIGVRYGLESMTQTAKAFHFNQRLTLHRQFGLALSAPTGRFPDLSVRDRYGLAQVSMGQGRILTTPLLMTLAAAVIANDGVAPKPKLGLSTPSGYMARTMTQASAAKLAYMMRRVVTEGTGRSVASSPLLLAGKTGTAENPHGASHAWFIGFAPYTNPKFAIGVLVEQGGFGSGTALSIAHEMLLATQAAGYLEAPR